MIVYGYSIEGLGVGGFANNSSSRPVRPIRFSTWTGTAKDDTGRDAAEYVECLTEDADEMESSLDIRAGRPTFGSLSLRVQMSSHLGWSVGNAPTLRSLMERFLQTSNPEPAMLLATDVTGSTEYTAQTIRASVQPFFDVPGDGDTIWLQGEAFYIRAVPSLVDSATRTYDFSVFPGAFETSISDYEVNDFNDIEIFTQNYVKHGRRVFVYTYDTVNETEVLEWTGLLQKADPDDTFTVVDISADGSLAWGSENKIGHQRVWFETVVGAAAGGDTTRYRSRRRVQLLDDDTLTFVRGKAIVKQKMLERQMPDGSWQYTLGQLQGAINGTFVDYEKEKKEDEKRTIDQCLVASEGNSFYPSSHPFDIWRAHLCSRNGDGTNGTYDVLPDGWGVGYPDELVDHDAFDSLRDGTAGGSEWYFADLAMNNYLLKAGQYNFDELTEMIFAPIMACPVRVDGQISVMTLLDPGPGEVVESFTPDDYIMDALPTLENNPWDPIRDLNYKVARRGADGGASGIIAASDIRRRQVRRFGSLAQDEELDCGNYGEPGIISGSWMDQEGLASLLTACGIRHDLINSNVRRLRSEFGPGQRIEPGETIALTDMGMPDLDGTRGITNRRFKVVASAVDPRTYNRRIEALEVFALSRADSLVAPHLVLGAEDSGDYPITGGDVSQEFFIDGYKGRLYNPTNLDLYDGVTYTLTVTSGFVRSLPSGLPEGLIFRFDDWDEVVSGQKDYTFIAGPDGFLGDNDDQTDRWSA